MIFGVDYGHKFSVLPDHFLEGGVSVHHAVEYTTKGPDIRLYTDLEWITKQHTKITINKEHLPS